MSEGNAMSIRIIKIINDIIKNDHELQEFTIIPTEDNTRNKSPVLYEEHNLGLESWCIKHVYEYACSVLFSQRKQLSRTPHSELEKLNRILIVAILINPEVGTFWNMKRELVEKDVLNTDDELYFSKIVLSHKSKSNEAFAYRRWLLSRILNKMAANHMAFPTHFLQAEFQVVHMASTKCQNNYHSWNHRIWCMENILTYNHNISQIVYSELNYSQEWINEHVSEHTGYHYRQYLIKLVKEHKRIVSIYESFYNFVVKSLLKTSNDGDWRNLLDYLLGKPNRTRLLEETCSYVNYISILLYDLFILIDQINEIYPEHEALYSHRKFLIHHLLKAPHDYHGSEFKSKFNSEILQLADGRNVTDSGAPDRSTKPDPSDNKLKMSVKQDDYVLYEILSTCERNFAAKNSNSMQLGRYRKWSKHVMGFE
ncbi:unnamed protein product [Phyllotreta striolata]|uniref:Protein prenyltransferase alpha subunit n=1 Tax=Phyllotreta striolata TaxID=444603 RepID=A0A9N9TLA3_PHYSR|nr:unnamed protein product [Phyllotreta striolata]